MDKRVKLTINDTLAFYDDYVGDYVFNESNVQTYDYFFKVPSEFLAGEHLNENSINLILKFLYGENWQSGNEDGSRFMILQTKSQLLSDANADEWLSRSYCYSVDETGKVSKISPQEF
ncbi:MAG TPA: hypothetical protein PKY59_18525 [Pyrinomonadaceae bacterium]|nr:hypothetical protein [Pyrinomonadaceae bacterium]